MLFGHLERVTAFEASHFDHDSFSNRDTWQKSIPGSQVARATAGPVCCLWGQYSTPPLACQSLRRPCAVSILARIENSAIPSQQAVQQGHGLAPPVFRGHCCTLLALAATPGGLQWTYQACNSPDSWGSGAVGAPAVGVRASAGPHIAFPVECIHHQHRCRDASYTDGPTSGRRRTLSALNSPDRSKPL